MTWISDQEILHFFKAKKNRYQNTAGMELGLSAGMEVWTYFSLCTHDYGPLAINISTEDDDVRTFIDGFNLKSIEELELLDYTRAWMRYLNSGAEITIIPFELDAPLRLKIDKRKTIIHSLELHFYDEVYEHLTMPEDFEKYIADHENRLMLAGENRYRMNKR